GGELAYRRKPRGFKQPLGERLVLFLTKSPSGEWLPAGRGSLGGSLSLWVSIAWIEEGDTYVFSDVGFGCRRLGSLLPESAFKLQVDRAQRAKAALAAARSIADLNTRVSELELLTVRWNRYA